MSESTAPHSWAGRADRLGRGLETFMLALVLSAMILLAAAQIVLRNLGAGGFAWADEALRIMVLWVTMLGAVAAGREQRHVSIDALSRYLPRRLQGWLKTWINLFVAVVSFVLAWYSYVFVADSRLVEDQVLAVLDGGIDAWTVQLILPAGFGLLGYRYLVACFISPADFRPAPRIEH